MPGKSENAVRSSSSCVLAPAATSTRQANAVKWSCAIEARPRPTCLPISLNISGQQVSLNLHSTCTHATVRQGTKGVAVGHAGAEKYRHEGAIQEDGRVQVQQLKEGFAWFTRRQSAPTNRGQSCQATTAKPGGGIAGGPGRLPTARIRRRNGFRRTQTSGTGPSAEDFAFHVPPRPTES